MAIDLVPRAEWGARAPRGSYSRLTSTRGIKVHYTGGRVDPGIVDDHAKCVAMVKSIQAFHMDGNGWMDIGYSMVACPHRKVFVGRGPGHLPAANGSGLNSGHYAVLGLVGNAGLVEPTDGILHAILDAIDYLRDKGGAGKEIKGHRDGYSTDCPGDKLYAWVKKGAPRPAQQPQPQPEPEPEPQPQPEPQPDPEPQPEPVPAPKWPGRLLTFPPVMRGDDVRTWQAQMKRLGFTLDVDGAYGQGSRDVCLAFQRRAHLDEDGVVGKQTWDASFAAQTGGK